MLKFIIFFGILFFIFVVPIWMTVRNYKKMKAELDEGNEIVDIKPYRRIYNISKEDRNSLESLLNKYGLEMHTVMSKPISLGKTHE
ncbi:hypothetical protein PP175_29345 (plasmid) [Aneurinibacillus sp. Ricciae_BoGa-3]|uniref:hypothetical protein n=1 Tax=Aneurinibacillus sp. Ricciae_BoGa-3 TaxID=3022697 RepID=UPI002340583A|nr:hypothetical protein [Aneurinibacillus sp. Ricciae_BoGa-3]WCK57298.1 hypothetical protein PP175_29345 [Aneurinibacillus sp. Ricciae_BoGa-3]